MKQFNIEKIQKKNEQFKNKIIYLSKQIRNLRFSIDKKIRNDILREEIYQLTEKYDEIIELQNRILINNKNIAIQEYEERMVKMELS